MVGRPWGQFQGETSPAILSSMACMAGAASGLPIITDDLQARIASIARTLRPTASGSAAARGWAWALHAGRLKKNCDQNAALHEPAACADQRTGHHSAAGMCQATHRRKPGPQTQPRGAPGGAQHFLGALHSQTRLHGQAGLRRASWLLPKGSP